MGTGQGARGSSHKTSPLLKQVPWGCGLGDRKVVQGGGGRWAAAPQMRVPSLWGSPAAGMVLRALPAPGALWGPGCWWVGLLVGMELGTSWASPESC